MFEHKLSIEEAKFAAIFIFNLVYNRCGPNGTNAPVYFIHGTCSHDNDQYDVYLNIFKRLKHVNIFYTDTACEITLQNGKTVLMLPQEYAGSVDYSKLLNKDKFYDIIVGHGPMSSLVNQPCQSKQTEIMMSTDLMGDISNICVFGHYHNYTEFDKNVFYAGAWLRWKYGEDKDCYFVICDDDFNLEKYPNKNAMLYETIVVENPEHLRKELSKEITNPHRFLITCNNDTLNEYVAIMNVYKRNELIKFNITNERKQQTSEGFSTINHATTSSVEPIPALLQYIIQKYEQSVDDEINSYVDKINRDKKKDE